MKSFEVRLKLRPVGEQNLSCQLKSDLKVYFQKKKKTFMHSRKEIEASLRSSHESPACSSVSVSQSVIQAGGCSLKTGLKLWFWLGCPLAHSCDHQLRWCQFPSLRWDELNQTAIRASRSGSSLVGQGTCCLYLQSSCLMFSLSEFSRIKSWLAKVCQRLHRTCNRM